MKLSSLQKYILKQCYNNTGFKIGKNVIENFYSSKAIKAKSMVGDITKSVERMIVKELVVGFGTKTAKKWYIREVMLTPKGKHLARETFVQQKLPKI